jgi:carbamate kinase
VSREELRRLAAEGHFPAGSMGPKIESALLFTAQPMRRAIICDPASLEDALHGRAGTIVDSDPE